MPYASVDGCRLFYQWDGAAASPVLMLSNALGTNLGMWDRQVAEFAQRFRVLRYDSRGHGRSDAPSGPYTIEQLGRDARALIESLGVARVDFCGVSKGGMVGMWLGRHCPHLVHRLVLANTSANLGPRTVWDDRIRAVTSAGMAAVADTVVARWFTPEFAETSPADVERCRQMLLSTPVPGYAGCCAAIRDMDQSLSIRGMSRPAMVVVGNRDPSTPPAHGEALASAIEGAILIRLHAAHLSNIEAAGSFNRAVMDWLASPGGQRNHG